jgi:hypothetical protein
MSELEEVQQALAHLPRPTPPPRLRRKIMAQVRREADAIQTQIYSRTEANGWITERWEGLNRAQEMIFSHSTTSVFYTYRHQDASGRMTFYQHTNTPKENTR